MLSGCTRLEALELQCPELNALFLRGCECCPQATPSPPHSHPTWSQPRFPCCRRPSHAPSAHAQSCARWTSRAAPSCATWRSRTERCSEWSPSGALSCRRAAPQLTARNPTKSAVLTHRAHLSQSATIDCPRLESLTLQQLPSTLLNVLPPAPTLTHLHFAQLQVVNPASSAQPAALRHGPARPPQSWSEEEMTALNARCGALRKLSLAGCALGGDMLSRLGSLLRTCHHLHSLDLSRATSVTDAVVAQVSRHRGTRRCWPMRRTHARAACAPVASSLCAALVARLVAPAASAATHRFEHALPPSAVQVRLAARPRAPVAAPVVSFPAAGR